MAQGQATEAAASLQRYAACKPAKLHTHIVKTLSLKELMRCFELPRKMGQTELQVVEDEVDVDAVAKSQADLSVVPLVLRPGISSATLYDLSECMRYLYMYICVSQHHVYVHENMRV